MTRGVSASCAVSCSVIEIGSGAVWVNRLGKGGVAPGNSRRRNVARSTVDRKKNVSEPAHPVRFPIGHAFLTNLKSRSSLPKRTLQGNHKNDFEFHLSNLSRRIRTLSCKTTGPFARAFTNFWTLPWP